jgi:hypothetical protein
MLCGTTVAADPVVGINVTELFPAVGSKPVPVICAVNPADAPEGVMAVSEIAARSEVVVKTATKAAVAAIAAATAK